MIGTIFNCLQLFLQLIWFKGGLGYLLPNTLIIKNNLLLIKKQILAYRYDLILFFLILCWCLSKRKFAYTVITLSRQFGFMVVAWHKGGGIDLSWHLE